MLPAARNHRVVPATLPAAMILLARQAPERGEWVQPPRGGRGEISFFRRPDLGP
jgi:hypothetical protein